MRGKTAVEHFFAEFLEALGVTLVFFNLLIEEQAIEGTKLGIDVDVLSDDPVVDAFDEGIEGIGRHRTLLESCN